jgi:hypothetical protein
MLLSPRRIIGEDGQPLRLNTIPELDENCSFEGSTTQARANYLNGSMKALTDEYESLRSSFNEMKTLLEATTR